MRDGNDAAGVQAVPALLAAAFMQLLDVGIVNVAVPTIQASLGASFAGLESIIAGYQVAFAVTLLPAARLGDRFGRRRLFLVGVAAFAAFSALSGAAHTTGMLVVARILSGVAAGTMFPQVISIIQAGFESGARRRLFAFYGTTVGVATVAGPLVGGLLIRADLAHLSWRLIFYVNVPIGIYALIAGAMSLPESKGDENGLDLGGAALAAAGTAMLVMGLLLGHQLGWPTWLKAELGLSPVVLAAFWLLESRRSRRDRPSLVSKAVLSSEGFALGSALFLIVFLGVAPFFFALSIFLQEGDSFSPLMAGVASAPFALGTAVASLATARLRVRSPKLMIAGLALLALSMALLIVELGRVSGHMGLIALVWPLSLAGIGLGLFIGPASAATLEKVPPAGAGSASGVITTLQQVGGALGVALISLVFFSFFAVNGGSAARAELPKVTAQLRTLAIPKGFVSEGESAFVTCIVDRAAQKDVSRLPESCLIIGGAIEQAPIPSALKTKLINLLLADGNSAVSRDFVLSLRETLGYEIAVFAGAILLLALAPSARRRPAKLQLPDEAKPGP
ncbi:MAG: MFS transporter [Actinomycetota bacterium]|nr:MFS transporter [Actinomycetota bacterium]